MTLYESTRVAYNLGTRSLVYILSRIGKLVVLGPYPLFRLIKLSIGAATTGGRAVMIVL